MDLSALHPRPQLQRSSWQNLDGSWEFAFDPAQSWSHPDQVLFTETIEVPYAPETPRSGLADPGFHPVVWYRKTAVPLETGKRVFLHFGAVDYDAQVWVNGHFVVRHAGGHTPFSTEITHWSENDGEVTIVVRAEDDPLDLERPRGKQDWQLVPHSIWYPRTTGIWQTVWLEFVPATFIHSLCWNSDLESHSLELTVAFDGPLDPADELTVKLTRDEVILVREICGVTGSTIRRRFYLPDGGIPDIRGGLWWSPEQPRLIDAELVLKRSGQEFDSVLSYTALRSVGLDRTSFLLNGFPYPLRMVLDQGYWPEGGLSATSEELRRDVLLAKRLGFNGVRKHQKLEDPRYLYWCDLLGLLVWTEMPSAYGFSTRSIEATTREWMEAIERDRSHPCVVAWVPFNESWGLPDLATNTRARAFARSLYHLTLSLDDTRPVIGNDGWEQVATDLLTVHDYTDDPPTIVQRYGSTESALNTLRTVRPAQRRLVLDDGLLEESRPILLTEFGGIAYVSGDEQDGWGYVRAEDERGFASLYIALLDAVHRCENLAGFCYTQLTDTYQEVNGILTADRKFKADPDLIANANRGPRSSQEQEREETPHPLGYASGWLQNTEQSALLATLEQHPDLLV